MSSAGRSGASDTGMENVQGAQSGSDLNGIPLGTGMTGTDPTAGDLQPDAVEVVEVVTLEGSPSPFEEDLYGTQTPLFRWWYVPAVAVPVVAGGALIWYLRKGQQPFKDFSDLLGRQGNNVGDWVQDRFHATRRQTPIVSRKTAALAGAVATAPIWDRAGDWFSDRRDDFSDLIDRDRARKAATSARDKARVQLKRAAKTTKATTKSVAASNRWDDFQDMLADTGDTVSDWWAGLRGATTPTAVDKARDLRDQVRGSAKSAATKATLAAGAGKVAVKAAKPAASTISVAAGAKDRTAKAAKKTGKSVNSAFKRTRTFTFAMLVTAMYTYMRMWRQRLNERTMRETARGRMEPDREPMFSR